MSRGSTLIESMLCVAIVVMLTATFATYWLGKKTYAIRAAVASFAAFVADARSVAQTSGSGATIVISGDNKGGFIAQLYPFRPLSGIDLSASSVRTLTANVNLTPTAVFISSSGTASAALWTPKNGTLATEPSCANAISLTFGDGFSSEAHAISCTQAELQ